MRKKEIKMKKSKMDKIRYIQQKKKYRKKGKICFFSKKIINYYVFCVSWKKSLGTEAQISIKWEDTTQTHYSLF